MDSKRAKQFVDEKYKQIATGYAGLTGDTALTSFLETALQEHATGGKEEFAYSFTGFGQQLTTQYTVSGILRIIAVHRMYKAAMQFKETQDQSSYDQLVQAYYYSVLLQLRCLKEQNTKESLYSADAALAMLLAVTYYPEDAKGVAGYLAFLFQENPELRTAKYDQLLGRSDLMPLALFAGRENGLSLPEQDMLPYITSTRPVYQQAIEHCFATDEAQVNAWVDALVDFHISNSQDDWTLPFNNPGWQFFPIEIISLLVLRARKGLNNDFISNPFIRIFIPFINSQVSTDALSAGVHDQL